MPVKSHSNTKKKKSLTNTQKKKSGSNKSGTAKRSKNRSRKGGTKRKTEQLTEKRKKTTSKKSPSPSPESSGDDEDNYYHQIFTEDGRVKRHNVEVDTFTTLPTPKYTAESKEKEDIAMYNNDLNIFYNEDEDVQALKAKPTDTKKQREKKKDKFATFPKLIEDSIFDKINKEMQPELDAWDEQNAKRDAEFGELIDRISEASRYAGRIDYDMEQTVNEEFDWVNREWKPEKYPDKVFGLDDKDPDARVRAAYHDDGPVAEGDEHNPRTDIENVLDTRIEKLSKYIQTKWNEEWEDAKPDSGKKMTDMLVEKYSIPGVVAALDHEDNVWEWDTNNMEIYDIQRWNAKWEKANNKEYKGSAEEETYIKKEMKKTNKNRTTVVAELNKNIAAEEKIRADAEEKDKRKFAAAANKKKKDEEAATRPSRKEIIRNRMKAQFATEPAARSKKLRISNTAENESATPIPPVPPAQKKISATPMPPAAGDGPTPMTTTEPSPISSTDAYKLANENEHITIHQSKSNPEMSYMFNNETNVSTWIVGEGPSGLYQSTQTPGQHYSINKQGTSEWLGTNEFSRVDADNTVENNPGRFEIRNHPEGGFDYLINKETGAVAKIFD
jgi:hypothetical protein